MSVAAESNSRSSPRLLREAKSRRRTLVFVDEAGFYLLPSVLRTYAPQALTPVLRAKLTRDRLSVMGGMTPQGRLYTLAGQESLKGSHTVEFLVHLLRVAAGRLLVVWDGSPIHRRTLVQDFASQAKGTVRVEALPGYAPDLNPWDEGGWNHLKNVEMPNLACKDLEELHEQFYLALNRLRHKQWLVRSFFTQAGLILPKVNLHCATVSSRSTGPKQIQSMLAVPATIRTFLSLLRLNASARRKRNGLAVIKKKRLTSNYSANRATRC